MKNYLYQTGGSSIGEIWNKVRSNAGHAMLRMLKAFYVSRKGYVQKSELYKQLRKYAASLGGGENLAQEVLEFSEFFRFTQNVGTNLEATKEYFASAGLSGIAGKQDRLIEAQGALQALALFKVKQTQALIYSAMLAIRRLGLSADATSAKAFTRMLCALESFHFINTAICSHIGNEVEHIYADLCLDFGKTTDFVKTVDSVIGQLQKKRAGKAEFSGNFGALEYSTSAKPKLAYIFDRMNNIGRAPGERKIIFYPERSEFDKSFNIEHIYAQKGSQPDRGMLTSINNIGNLIVISKQLNSKLGNKPVNAKFDELRGLSATRISEFPAVGRLLKDFGDAASEWNDDTIARRSASLADFAYEKVWRF
ncbi:MAG TPA: HNH endonuclease family protein [Edaphobacter sp.]|nr:HNH endonuclease family protein [Edaphobacter sp.]